MGGQRLRATEEHVSRAVTVLCQQMQRDEGQQSTLGPLSGQRPFPQRRGKRSEQSGLQRMAHGEFPEGVHAAEAHGLLGFPATGA